MKNFLAQNHSIVVCCFSNEWKYNSFQTLKIERFSKNITYLYKYLCVCTIFNKMDLCAIPTSRYILTCTKVVHYLFPESQLVTKVTLYIHNSNSLIIQYILDKMSVIFYIFQWLESTFQLSHHSSYRSPKIFNFKVKLV